MLNLGLFKYITGFNVDKIKLERMKRFDEKYCYYYTENCTCFIKSNIVIDIKEFIKWSKLKLNLKNS